MSQENVEIVRQNLDAFDRRDRAAWLALRVRNCEVIPSAMWPEVDAIRGHEAAWDFYIEVAEPFQRRPLAPDTEAVDAGSDKVLVHYQTVVRGRASGADVELNYWVLVTFREGKILRDEWFTDRADALEAAGLREQAMSEGNVELISQLIGAFNQRNLAAMTPSFDPDVEWTPGGPAAVEREVYRGRDEVSSAFAATWETWEVFHLEESEVRDLGDSLVWLGRARLTGGASHVELDQAFAIHFLVRGGKIVRFRGFREWQQALEAAGLRE